jgi:hypothetical protein
LQLLVYATNILQAAHTRLDDILLIFGFLYHHFDSLMDDDDYEVCEGVLKSLEKRWADSHQAVFLAMVILHPLYLTKPFKCLDSLTKAGIQNLLAKLWRRFKTQSNGEPLPIGFMLEIVDYPDEKGLYKN